MATSSSQSGIGLPAGVTGQAGAQLAGQAATLAPFAYANPIAQALVKFLQQRVANGTTSAALELKLAGNALVHALDVVVQADRASWSALGAVGQVRRQDGPEQVISVVVDFGTPRTVSAVAVVDTDITPSTVEPPGGTLFITGVRAWVGNAFDDALLYPPYPQERLPSTAVARFTAEVRTERLQLYLTASKEAGLTDQIAAERLAVELPSLPGDLELRIDGGPPVWTWPGPVQPGTGADDWKTVSGATQKTVSLRDALAKLTGDPDRPEERTFHLELVARQPGLLSLVEKGGSRKVSYLVRTPLEPEGRKDLVFDTEGAQELALTLPSGAKKLEEVRLTVSGALPSERGLPPVGPAVAAEADLLLNPDRAACVRLSQASGLKELTGVRLPLRAQAGGAEVRVLLLAHQPDGSAEGTAGVALEGASASNPVVLEAPPAGDTSDTWTLFEFPKPVALRGELPWAAVLVGRGTVEWSLGRSADGETPLPLRRGGPTGPWEPLPAAITLSGEVGGRVHALGHAASGTAAAQPVRLLPVHTGAAPVAGTPEVLVTPTARGVTAKWPTEGSTFVLDVTGKTAGLRITTLTAGTVTLSDVVAVVSK